jgi:glycosyltransferase involved in cell wall biosynthesis
MASNKIKILLVARDCPSQNNSGRGIFELDQAKALQQCGHEVALFSLDFRSIRRKRKLGFYSFATDGVQIFNFSFPLGNVPDKLSILLGRTLLKWKFNRVVSNFGKPDIIHSHYFGMSAIASILKEEYNIPHVHTEHSSRINNDYLSNQTIALGKKEYEDLDAIIAVSSRIASVIKKNWDTEPIVIPNIVDTNIFSYSERKKNNQNFKFISVGNLKFGKGFDVLIEAFNNATLLPNTELCIIGSGEEKEHLKKLIRKHKLEKRVHLLGRQERDSIALHMSSSDAFVLASKGETFGVAYIEALSAGLPVVATSCGGPSDFIDSTNGYLVEVDNKTELAATLEKIQSEIAKFNNSEISTNTKERFSSQTISSQLTKIYEKILAK